MWEPEAAGKGEQAASWAPASTHGEGGKGGSAPANPDQGSGGHKWAKGDTAKGPGKGDRRCYNCQAFGHMARDCPVKPK